MAHGKKRFWMKNPAISILLVLIVVTYFIFASQPVIAWGVALGESSYFASFVAGLLFASGLLAPFGAGLWSVLTPSNIVLAVLFGAVGGAIVDVLLLDAIKKVIANTTKKVVPKDKNEKKAHLLINTILGNPIGRVLVSGIVFELTGFIKVIPLPYKLNNTLILSILKVSKRHVAIMSFIIYLIVATFFICFKYALPVVLAALGFK